MNIYDFLKLEKPELYDLKDENNYSGNNSLEKMLEYRNSRDGFDCDGSLVSSSKRVCALIREIYRVLWGWQDINKKSVERYASTCLGNDLMGPETMNSFQTTYTAAIRFGIDKKDYQKLVKFANIVGRIGNMTLTYKGKNRYIAYDYWDIKINRQYIIDDKLSDIEKKDI